MQKEAFYEAHLWIHPFIHLVLSHANGREELADVLPEFRCSGGKRSATPRNMRSELDYTFRIPSAVDHQDG